MQKVIPTYSGTLRSHSLEVPDCIAECSGIRIFGRRIKSLVFSTAVAIIKNVNADAIIAVYPFTPQPSIAQAIINVSDVPVLVGVGGSFDVLSGSKKRAPQFFVKTNTEWLYRIAKEPQRLGRFWNNNVKFMQEVRKVR